MNYLFLTINVGLLLIGSILEVFKKKKSACLLFTTGSIFGIISIIMMLKG